MKTAVLLYKDGKKVEPQDWHGDPKSPYKVGLWPDDGTAYGVRGVLRAMGLPNHVDLIRRESTARSLDDADRRGVEYVVDWNALARSLANVHKAFLKTTEETGDLLPIEVAELPGVVYAEHKVRDGGDALALFAKKKEEAAPVNDADGHFHHAKPLKVRAVVRGVSQNGDGIMTPCVYVLYEGDRRKIAGALHAMSDIADMIASDPERERYTLRISRA